MKSVPARLPGNPRTPAHRGPRPQCTSLSELLLERLSPFSRLVESTYLSGSKCRFFSLTPFCPAGIVFFGLLSEYAVFAEAEAFPPRHPYCFCVSIPRSSEEPAVFAFVSPELSTGPGVIYPVKTFP